MVLIPSKNSTFPKSNIVKANASKIMFPDNRINKCKSNIVVQKCKWAVNALNLDVTNAYFNKFDLDINNGKLMKFNIDASDDSKVDEISKIFMMLDVGTTCSDNTDVVDDVKEC